MYLTLLNCMIKMVDMANYVSCVQLKIKIKKVLSEGKQ